MATHLHATSVAAVATDDDATCSPRENGPTPLVPECDRPALHDSADRNPSQPHEELASLLPANPVDPVKSSTLYDRHVPWFAWPLLVASLIAFSSAAVVFASIPDVPTCTLAAWRLQLTTFLLTPAAVYQFLHLPAGIPVDSLPIYHNSAVHHNMFCLRLPEAIHQLEESAQNNMASLQMTGSVCARTSCLCLPLVPFLGFTSSSGFG